MMYLNCMSVKSGAGLYAKMIEGLVDEESVLEKSEEDTLKDLFTASTSSTSTSKHVVTLDEIDALLPTSPEILYTLFSLALAPRSRLILIGIANALDLTDRFLPRLKAKNIKPHLLPFLPYTAKQITEVITTKLQSLVPLPIESSNAQGQNDGFVPFVHPTAIAFCAKKVASQTGDLRKAFDIVRKVIELVDAETKQKYLSAIQVSYSSQSPPSSRKSPLGENNNLASPPSSSRPSPAASTPLPPSTPSETLNPRTAPRATIAHLAKVTSSALSQGPGERLKTLNLQQKAALCALLSLQQQKETERDGISSAFGGITPSSSIGRSKAIYGDYDDGFIGSPFKKNNNRNEDIFSSPPSHSTPSKRQPPPPQSPPTIRSLYTQYTTLCTRSSSALQPLSSTEFADVVTGLETMGLVVFAEGSKSRGNNSATTTPTTTVRGGRFVDRFQLTPLSCKSKRTAMSSGGSGKEERRLVACVGRKDVEGSLGEGVAGESLRGFFEG